MIGPKPPLYDEERAVQRDTTFLAWDVNMLGGNYDREMVKQTVYRLVENAIAYGRALERNSDRSAQ